MSPGFFMLEDQQLTKGAVMLCSASVKGLPFYGYFSASFGRGSFISCSVGVHGRVELAHTLMVAIVSVWMMNSCQLAEPGTNGSLIGPVEGAKPMTCRASARVVTPSSRGSNIRAETMD